MCTTAIDTGITLDPDQVPEQGADVAELAGLAPYWLGHPMENSVVLIGCCGHQPALCVEIDVNAPHLRGSMLVALSEFARLRLDTAVAIGYGDRACLDAVVGYQPQDGAVELDRYPNHWRTALLWVDPAGGQVRRCYSAQPHQWEPTGVSLADAAVAAMHAGHHAWGRMGVLDACHPFTNQPDLWGAARAKARKARAREPLASRLADDRHTVDLWPQAAELPNAATTAVLGEALLDCRVLDQAVTDLARADQPRVDLWLWCARTLPDGRHWAAGMAGIAAYFVGRGPAARALLGRQMRLTADERTAMVRDAIEDHLPLRDVIRMIGRRPWNCKGPCCTDPA
jgi:hypothetical protein